MLGNSPIADFSISQWQQVVSLSTCVEYSVEQVIDKPSNFAIWLIDSGGVCIIRGQERHYYQQGQIMAVDAMMGEFSVSSNTRLLCFDGASLQALSTSAPETAKIIYNLAAQQQFQSEVLELIEQYCGPLRLVHRTEILAACQWQSVSPGDVLVNRGERCFHWHIVLHGKLCGVRKMLTQADIDYKLNGTFEQQVDTYRLRGDCFGQTALLGNGEYQLSFVAKTAVRLVKFKRDIFDLLWQHYENFKQLIATELAMSHAAPLDPLWGDKIALASIGDFKRSNEVIERLAESEQNDSKLIGFEPLAKELGLPIEVGHMVRHPGWYSIYRWWQDNLDESMYLDCDSRYPAWQSFCVANANKIIGLLDTKLDIDGINSELLSPRFGIERWLLLCHQEDVKQPKGTSRWLSKFAEPKFLHWRFGHAYDSARVNRTIKGQAVAITLQGCYRTSVAQIGVLKQLQSQGFAADIVQGNGFSMLLAALYALEFNLEQIHQQLVINPHLGLKSLRFGRLVSQDALIFERIFKDCFSKTSIEDMWLPFICFGVDINHQVKSVANGKLRHAVKSFGGAYHRTQPASQRTLEHNYARHYEYAKEVIIEVKYKNVNSVINPLSRWFGKDDGQLQEQLEFQSVVSEQGDLAGESDLKPNIDLGDDAAIGCEQPQSYARLSLKLDLPTNGSNNQTFLEKLVNLGLEQSKPLMVALND